MLPAQNIKVGGNFIPKHKDLRIWNINANTLLSHNNLAELHDLRISLIKYNVDIINMQEINLDLLDPYTCNTITSVFNQLFLCAKLSIQYYTD